MSVPVFGEQYSFTEGMVRMGEKSERDREDSRSVRTDEVHQKNSEDPEMLKEYC